jgi:hypothetical protein
MQLEDGLFGAAKAQELKIYYASLFMVLAVILVPLWLVTYPGMVDYPNHLARCYIVAHYHDNPLWQQLYILDRQPLPNLAIDLIVTPMLRFLPLIVCGKIFLSLAAVLYVVGCGEAGRAIIGRPNWLALICAFTFYNSSLLYGFVNYVFGIGVFLCVLAFWLRIRNAMTPFRFVVCCFLSFAAYLAHLSSLVFLGVACVTIALLDFARDRKGRDLIIKTVWLGCPLLFLGGFVKKHSGQVGTIDWGSPSEKLITLLAPVSSYSWAMYAGMIVVLAVCGWVVLRGSSIRNTALVSAVLFALVLVTPKALLTNTASGADERYVIPAYLLLMLSIEPRWGRWQKLALGVALSAMLVHTESITANWLAISHRSEQVLEMGNTLPQGARVYALSSGSGSGLQSKLDRGLIHVIQFWTVSHGAEISNLFAIPGSQPLVFRSQPCEGPEWTECLSTYDYIWTDSLSASMRPFVLQIATPIATSESATLWRVNKSLSVGPVFP